MVHHSPDSIPRPEGKIDIFACSVVGFLGGLDIELPPLYLCEVRPLKSICVVRLRTWSIKRDRFDPEVFVTFNEAAKFLATDVEVLRRQYNERMQMEVDSSLGSAS